MIAAPAPIALYIHWPFCVSKCPYCDFNSHVREQVDQNQWREALLADLAWEMVQMPNARLGSIFFGGGTPSLMPPETVAALIEAARNAWPVADDLEITLEANPSSVEAARFADIAAAGVNRVSLGLQSLDDEALHFLGRAHSVNEGLAALEIAQKHFARVNVDLIYALPTQSPDAWSAQLQRALSFGTHHLSLYQLTIEPGTRFATMVAANSFTPLDAESSAQMYELTTEITQSANRPAYEISNYAAPGEESRHNLTYWRYGDYLGIGPGAHGRRNGLATVRHKKPENWLAAVARNGHGLAEEEPLTPEMHAREALVMGLRLSEGVDIAALSSRFGFAPSSLIDAAKAKQLSDHGLLAREGDHLTILPEGRLLLDRILAEIVSI